MKDTAKNREFVKKQLARLSLKDFAPREPDQARSVVDALVKCADSPEHVERIVDEIEREEGNFPEIATFYRIASSTRRSIFVRDPQCTKCDASGHVAVEKDGYKFSKRCDCWAWRSKDELPQWKREGAYTE